jgi:hypothetical protein
MTSDGRGAMSVTAIEIMDTCVWTLKDDKKGRAVMFF